MATTKKRKRKEQPKSFKAAVGLTNIFNDEKLNFVLGLILVLLSIYVVVCFISFFSTGGVDQSILCESRVGEWLNSHHEYKNYCGSFGAIIAWTLMGLNFGLSAFLIPVFIVILGLHLMNIKRFSMWRWFIGLTFVMVWCSIAFAKLLTPILGMLTFNPGGEHGVFIVEKIENLVGAPGLIALLLLTALIFLTIVTSKTIIWVRKVMRFGVDHKPKVPWSVVNPANEEQGEQVEEAPEPEGDDDQLSEGADEPNGEVDPNDLEELLGTGGDFDGESEPVESGEWRVESEEKRDEVEEVPGLPVEQAVEVEQDKG